MIPLFTARSIIFVAWDAEEYGLIGSTEFVEEFVQQLGERSNISGRQRGSHIAIEMCFRRPSRRLHQHGLLPGQFHAVRFFLSVQFPAHTYSFLPLLLKGEVLEGIRIYPLPALFYN